MKMVGMAFIMASFTAGGLLASARCAKRAEYLREFLALSDYIITRLKLYRSPLGKIYAAYRSPLLERCGFLSALRNGAWEAAIEAVRGNAEVPLETGDYTQLLAFGERLGRDSTEKQVQSASIARDAIAAVLSSAEEEYGRKGRLYRAGGAIIGAFICILLF